MAELTLWKVVELVYTMYICIPMEQIIYTNLDSLIELYRMGDLPTDVLAFAYHSTPGSANITWIHKDELRRMADLQAAYPAANTQKAQK